MDNGPRTERLDSVGSRDLDQSPDERIV